MENDRKYRATHMSLKKLNVDLDDYTKVCKDRQKRKEIFQKSNYL